MLRRRRRSGRRASGAGLRPGIRRPLRPGIRRESGGRRQVHGGEHRAARLLTHMSRLAAHERAPVKRSRRPLPSPTPPYPRLGPTTRTAAVTTRYKQPLPQHCKQPLPQRNKQPLPAPLPAVNASNRTQDGGRVPAPRGAAALPCTCRGSTRDCAAHLRAHPQ